MPIRSRRRHRRRLAPGAPWKPSDWRRRTRHGGDDRRLARCAHLALVRRSLRAASTQPRGSASSISSTRRAPRKSAFSSGMRAAKARRSVCGRATTSRSSEGGWPLVSASPIPYFPDRSPVPREMTRDGHAPRRSRLRRRRGVGRTKPGSTCSKFTWRTVICWRRSSRRSPTSGRTSTADRSKTACVSRLAIFDACRLSGQRTSR